MLWCMLPIFWAALLHSAGPVSGGNCVKPLTCMPALECSTQLGDSAHSFTLFACGQNNLWVCCPQPTDRIKASPSIDKMRLLPNINDCAPGTDDKITGGENATQGQFPWMALLGYRLNKEDPLEFRCGGSIINNRYILTAAHCIKSADKAVLEKVRLNELNTETDPECTTFINRTICSDPVLDVDIESVVSHEDYNKPYLKNDIALIRLKSNVTFSPDNISPICLPFGLNITGFEETNYTVAGWGKRDNYDVQGSPVLQFVSLWTVPLHDCNPLQAAEVVPLSNTTQLCAGGQPGKDSCKGDSGGPLMFFNKYGKVMQVGIVSFGGLLCGRSTPSVYTRVTAYLDWILKNIEP